MYLRQISTKKNINEGIQKVLTTKYNIKLYQSTENGKKS